MTKLTWDASADRKYETGVDQGILFVGDSPGVAWNGLTTVTESPSGAEVTPQYADNIQYLTLLSVEMFGGTIEAFTYPDEFLHCDGYAGPPATTVNQQPRKPFSLAYRTKVGNADDGNLGYKWHLIYNMLAKPSEKAYATLNDSPDPIAFSWDFTTTPSNFGGTWSGKPLSLIVIDSTRLNSDGLVALATFEDTLLGTSITSSSLPGPSDILNLFDV